MNELTTTANTFQANVNVALPSVKHLYIYPVKDTYVSQANQFLNYGMFGEATVSNSINGDNAGLFGFDKIDLSTYGLNTSLIKMVKFELIIKTSAKVKTTQIIQDIKDNTWMEYGATWAGQPAYDTTVAARTNVLSSDTGFSFDITKDFKNNYTTKYNANPFGFRLTSDGMFKNTLGVYTKESIKDYLKPCIDIVYYDYGVAPIVAMLPFDVVPVIPIKTDVNFDLSVKGTNSRAEVLFDLSVPKFAVDPVEIAFDMVTVQYKTPVDVNFDLSVPKFPADPAEIAFDFYILNECDPEPEIEFSLSVPLQAISAAVDFTMEAATKIAPYDINFDLGVTPDPVSPQLITFDMQAAAKIKTDVEFTVSVDLQPVTTDVDFDFVTTPGLFPTITFDLTVPKIVVPAVSIPFDFVSTHTEVVEINFTADFLSRVDSDIDFDVDPIPVVKADIEFNITPIFGIKYDIDFDVYAEQRDTVFVDFTLKSLQLIRTDVAFDVYPEIYIKREVAFDLTVIRVNATFGFLT